MTATGPRTVEGKRRSSRNALRHGLLARELVLEGESRGQFDALASRLVEHLSPVGELEHLLVERVASCVWRLRRLLLVEAQLVRRLRRDPFDDAENDGEVGLAWLRRDDLLANVSRYEVTLERSLYRAVHELERLQAARRGQAVPVPQVVEVGLSLESEGR